MVKYIYLIIALLSVQCHGTNNIRCMTNKHCTGDQVCNSTFYCVDCVTDSDCQSEAAMISLIWLLFVTCVCVVLFVLLFVLLFDMVHAWKDNPYGLWFGNDARILFQNIIYKEGLFEIVLHIKLEKLNDCIGLKNLIMKSDNKLNMSGKENYIPFKNFLDTFVPPLNKRTAITKKNFWSILQMSHKYTNVIIYDKCINFIKINNNILTKQMLDWFDQNDKDVLESMCSLYTTNNPYKKTPCTDICIIIDDMILHVDKKDLPQKLVNESENNVLDLSRVYPAQTFKDFLDTIIPTKQIEINKSNYWHILCIAHKYDKDVYDECKKFITDGNVKITSAMIKYITHMKDDEFENTLWELYTIQNPYKKTPHTDICVILEGSKLYTSKTKLQNSSKVFDAIISDSGEDSIDLTIENPIHFKKLLDMIVPHNKKKFDDMQNYHWNVFCLAHKYDIANIINEYKKYIIKNNIALNVWVIEHLYQLNEKNFALEMCKKIRNPFKSYTSYEIHNKVIRDAIIVHMNDKNIEEKNALKKQNETLSSDLNKTIKAKNELIKDHNRLIQSNNKLFNDYNKLILKNS